MIAYPPSAPYRRRRAIVPVVIVALLVAAGVVAYLAHHKHSSHKTTKGATGIVAIKVDGGASLVGFVQRPSGPGPYPLVVMPGSWTAKAKEYQFSAPKLVAKGFEVVSYAQRGVGGSTGSVDFAGVQTQKDVSSVIDWALAHTAADPKHIAAAGISYGAVMSLMAAERDPRIKAVVAMSGFANFYNTFAPNGAGARSTLLTLLSSSKVRGNLTSDPQVLLDDLVKGDANGVDQKLRAMSPSRSADKNVAALNSHHTAVLLANAYQDSVLPPADMLAFYSELTGPKRLQMAPGDHGGPEASSLQGTPNAVWNDAVAWLQRYGAGDAHVKGAAQGVVLTDSATGAAHHYDNVAAMTARTEQLYLDRRSGSSLGLSQATGWTADVREGQDSAIALPKLQLGGPYRIASVQSAWLGLAPAEKWTSAASPTAFTVSGIASLRATLRSTDANLSFVAYLFDLGPNGAAQLMTYAPLNQQGVPANTSRDVTVQFQPISWTVAAGHQIVLVLDGADQRFFTDTQQGTLTIDASNSPAVLRLPIAPAA